ncbi:MAG: glycoside hydrolase family 97 protein [Prevotella sp.]|nr:glycoside hydrolase family 97 protein [Prevotella sp.]
MKQRLLTFGLIVCYALVAMADSRQVLSPDGRLSLTVSVEQGCATYSVAYDGRQLLLPSRLGLLTSVGDYSQGLTLKGAKEDRVERHYDMTRTKAAHADAEARQLVVSLANAQGHRMDVTFWVANHDVAFRYTLHRQQKDNPKCAVVTAEATSYRLPDGTTTFLSPQSKSMVGWERTKPSYEEVYSADAPMTARSQFGEGYVFPALFHVGHDGWVLLSETGVNGSYVGSHLSDYDAQAGYTVAFPMAGELNGVGTTGAGITLPGSTPWRTITVGNTLAPIVETTVSYDVVEPLYEPSQDYQPGRYTWSWLIWQDQSINYADQVQFIDLAAQMGFEYCLVDNWWDERIGRDRIAELSRYAQQKGVSLLLWYNSNGYANDAPQTPRQCMNTGMARDREMAWLRSIGVKGIKVDFFGGDKQPVMQLYEDILYDANRYGLQVIFHGCTLPRGWERMYPNYVASEAVLASENVYFAEDAAQREPFDLTLHPFCRNATAAMDWGGVIMNRYLSRDNKSRHSRKTTDVFEMASGVTLQSAVQCVAMQPNNLAELPAVELDFLRSLPTTWDETRYIDGYPGRYVVLARRHGDRWLVAGLNAEPEAKRLTLSLPMLAGQTVSYYTDGKDGYAQLRQLKVDKRGQAKVTMQPNGGMILDMNH